MSAPASAGPRPEAPGLQPPDFGRPSPALIARADRGYARFLATQTPDPSTGDHDETTTRRAPDERHPVGLHDTHGLIEAELPLDRALHEELVNAVLAWKDPCEGTPVIVPGLTWAALPHSVPGPTFTGSGIPPFPEPGVGQGRGNGR
ncbi:hypothetical protein [Streptomyces sp. NPDC002666]